MAEYIDELLPEEYEKCLVGLNAITKEAWNTSQNTEDWREKIQALSLDKECYSMKMDLLTNATVVDDAIRFVSQKSKGDSIASVNKHEVDKEESSWRNNSKSSFLMKTVVETLKTTAQVY